MIKSAIAMAALLYFFAGCNPSPVVVGGPKREAVKMGDVTLDNGLGGLMKMPDGQDYIEAPGRGVPPDSEKDAEVRKRMAKDLAVIDAEKALIVQLGKLVPRNKIQDLLRKAKLGALNYGYDDSCMLTLKINREDVQASVGQREPLTP